MSMTMHTDWELAYKMQLDEAMAASMESNNQGISTPGGNETHEWRVKRVGNRGGSSDAGTGLTSQIIDRFSTIAINDVTTALQFQSGELVRIEQEEKDKKKAVEESQNLVLELRRRQHDRKFAQSLEEISDEEWEREGDYYEKPFYKIDDDDWDNDQVCKLYIAKSREEPGYVAMAWSLVDEEGRVLLEQCKYLGGESAGYVGEYTALIEGLALAVAAGVKHITACCNSLVICNQIQGHAKPQTPKLIKFLDQFMYYRAQLNSLFVECVPKHRNVHAINLANEAIHRHRDEILHKAQNLDDSTGQDASSSGEQGKLDDCPICFEKILEADMFVVKGCLHSVCVSCLRQHVEIRVKENQVPVRCPLDCTNLLDIDQCRGMIPPDVAESYAKSLTEASIPESERVYCPFPNCSALMSRGGLNPSVGASSSRCLSPITFGCTECMECHRLFCADCRVPWHADMSCEEYENLPPGGRDAEDIKLYQLANNKNWQRCKECRRMIELDQGCYHMTCRCGHEFCYICGASWINKQATCKCKLWDEEHIVGDPLPSDSESEDSDTEMFDFDLNLNLLLFTPQPRAYKTKLCRYWAAGHCRYGVRCYFAHGDHELRGAQLRF